MLVKIHPKIEAALRYKDHGTIIDGAFATEAIDTSGEIISIKGADISSLNEDGILNTEHQNPDKKETATFSVIIGRIMFAKKIFSEQDCESERELKLWNELQLPFIYGAAELFDKEDHSNAKDAAAIIKHYHRRGLPIVIRYSIEGSTVQRDGNHLLHTIARRVAATIKPCNRSSFNSLVSEPEPKQVGVDIQKNEKYIHINEMEYDVLIETTLNKTLTLGSADASPGTLTGGAALGKEDLLSKKLYVSCLKAAARDWDGSSDFEKYVEDFLKHSLGNVADKFISKYGKMSDQIQLVKKEREFDLAELAKKPKGTVKFKGKSVIPGLIELIAGPFKGSKLKLFHIDDNYVYVKPPKASDQSEVNINKINRKQEGSHFIIAVEPEAVHEPLFIDGNTHTDLDHTRFHDQKILIHGIDLGLDAESTPHTSTWHQLEPDSSYGWFKSAAGKMAHIKPAVDYEQEPEKELKPPTSEREVIFYNLSRLFFGLDSVPTTSLFKHPNSKKPHSAMEVHAEAVHFHSESSSAATRAVLLKEGVMGELDKMAIMDIVLGNRDRNRHNYMIDRRMNKILLIDNALTFDYNKDEIPSYIEDYARMKGKNIYEKRIHPEARAWLVSLDAFVLKEMMDGFKIHPELTAKAVKRLLAMQSLVVLGNTSFGDILMAYKTYGV